MSGVENIASNAMSKTASRYGLKTTGNETNNNIIKNSVSDIITRILKIICFFESVFI